MKENADRVNTACLQKTTLPYEDNYLDLDPVVKDPLGFPVCRITADYKDNERKISDFIQEKMELWYRAAGAIDIVRGPLGTMGVNTHAYGGTRMGDNVETNVVDIMDALKKSLDAVSTGKKKTAKAAASKSSAVPAAKRKRA